MNVRAAIHNAPAVLAALVALNLVLPREARAQGLTTAQVAEKATPATVTIVTLGAADDTIATGSGFIVRSDGVIVTNWHVLRGAAAAVVVRANGEAFRRVSFLDGDSTADIAIIKVPGYDLPVLTPRSTTPAVGERVIAIGSPLGLSRTVTEGIVSADRIVDGREYVQVSAAISPGSSGGAVLDSEGRVFAISTAFIEGGQQLNFAIPVRYALGLMRSNLSERTLSSVFGAEGARTSTHVAAANQEGSATGPGDLLRRASVLRSSMDGVYAVQLSSSKGATYGLLVSADGRGWINAGALTFHVSRLRTNRAGAVLLALGDLAFDGYQTKAGGFLVRTAPLAAVDTGQISIVALPDTLPLSDTRGLYDAECRTRLFQNGMDTGAATDWTGTLVALTNNGDIYVDLEIMNALGGSSGISASSPLAADGSFRMQRSADGGMVRLAGTVTPGTIVADWRDQRGADTWFECRLTATRR